ncbi:MAG TPA: hypothetical protein VHK04_12080, partial [Castellaniella sp.]|nr:hypothetical protein [Castellaniella sp.]
MNATSSSAPPTSASSSVRAMRVTMGRDLFCVIRVFCRESEESDCCATSRTYPCPLTNRILPNDTHFYRVSPFQHSIAEALAVE